MTAVARAVPKAVAQVLPMEAAQGTLRAVGRARVTAVARAVPKAVAQVVPMEATRERECRNPCSRCRTSSCST